MAIRTRPHRRGNGKPFAIGNPGRPKGAVNHATKDIKAIARGMLEDPAYVAALRQRLLTGEANAVEALLFHYGYGKPKETVSFEGGNAPLPLIVKLTE